MNSSQNAVLTIAPGKRELGIAVFNGTELVYASVKTIKHRKSRKYLLDEIAGILKKLLESFRVKVVVTKAVSQYQRLSSDLERIVKRIKFESRRAGLPVVEIKFEQIKSVLCKGEKTTQKKAFETLLESYPELKKYWNRPNKWQKDYYAFLFSAVAVGAVYLEKTVRM